MTRADAFNSHLSKFTSPSICICVHDSMVSLASLLWYARQNAMDTLWEWSTATTFTATVKKLAICIQTKVFGNILQSNFQVVCVSSSFTLHWYYAPQNVNTNCEIWHNYVYYFVILILRANLQQFVSFRCPSTGRNWYDKYGNRSTDVTATAAISATNVQLRIKSVDEWKHCRWLSQKFNHTTFLTS